MTDTIAGYKGRFVGTERCESGYSSGRKAAAQMGRRFESYNPVLHFDLFLSQAGREVFSPLYS
jgi:hypothetical protein